MKKSLFLLGFFFAISRFSYAMDRGEETKNRGITLRVTSTDDLKKVPQLPDEMIDCLELYTLPLLFSEKPGATFKGLHRILKKRGVLKFKDMWTPINVEEVKKICVQKLRADPTAVKGAENTPSKKLAEVFIQLGELNPFYHYLEPHEYQDVDREVFNKLSSHLAYQKQLEDFFQQIGFTGLKKNTAGVWSVRKKG